MSLNRLLPLIPKRYWTPDKHRIFLRAWIGENVQLIKGLYTETLSRVQKVVQSMIGGGITLRDAGKEITEALNIQQNRRMRIAIDQSRKAMGDLTNLRMKKLGIKLYRWSAVMDKRKNGGTCPSHAAMNNKICRFDDPSIYFNEKTKQWEKRKCIGGGELHPSQDFNCRCTRKVILQSI
ncbi:MAG: phage minor head protein [Candidatus Phlomobacter fragariae]